MTNTRNAIREHLASHPFEPCYVWPGAQDDPRPGWDKDLYIHSDEILPATFKGEIPPALPIHELNGLL